MTTIHLQTSISAPAERCFDLSRSIDLHQSSMHQTNEKVIAGRQSGLIEQGEFVTWQATHFFIKQNLSSIISEMERPNYFIDEMLQGAFKSLWHKHTFRLQHNSTLMIDEFKYEVPFGYFGRLFNKMILNKYMIDLLKSRNQQIKKAAESEDWKKYLIAV